jgi:hypothetical protein
MERIAVCAFAFWSVVTAATAHATDVPVNALWNDDDGFGLFLYGRPGSCAQFQYKNPPFVVVGNGGKKAALVKVDAQSVKVCMRATPPAVAFCREGQLEARYDFDNDEYLGSYQLRLDDGSEWSGQLRAQHCPITKK